MEGNTFLTPSSRARGHRASASSALLQELERTAANASASSGGRGSLGISRELSKLINKKTPTMTKEQVMRKVRGQQGGGGGEEDEEEECVEGLTLYETYREPISPPDDPQHTTTLQVRTLNVELTCPICLGIMRQTMTVMECLHRFCDECISKCLRWGKKECPTCRVHCSSRRHLRPDPNFDALIATVYPNLDEYEAQEQEFIADINKRMNRKSLTDSVEKGLMRQMAASRGPRAKRDKEQLEAMEAPSTTPSSSSSSSSSSSRKRKPTPSSAASSSSSSSSSSSTVSSAPAGVSSSSSSSSSSRSKNSKRSKSQDTRQRSGSGGGLEPESKQLPEATASSMELDASGIPLAHYHIPHKRMLSATASGSTSSSSSTSPSSAVASFLSQVDTLISFLLLPHPDFARLHGSTAQEGNGSTTEGGSSATSSNNLVLQRPYLRTSRRVTVKQIVDFLASKFPQSPLNAPAAFDLLVPPPANAAKSDDEQHAPAKPLFAISIVPTTTAQEEEEETKMATTTPAKETRDKPTADHVVLDSEQSVDAIASRYWDGKGDLTLYYRLLAA